MGLFVCSNGNMYILIVAYCVSKYGEAVTLLNNEGKMVTTFFKKIIFSRFGTTRALISDGASHFCNRLFFLSTEKHRI